MDQLNKRVRIDSRSHWQSTLYVQTDLIKVLGMYALKKKFSFVLPGEIGRTQPIDSIWHAFYLDRPLFYQLQDVERLYRLFSSGPTTVYRLGESSSKC